MSKGEVERVFECTVGGAHGEGNFFKVTAEWVVTGIRFESAAYL